MFALSVPRKASSRDSSDAAARERRPKRCLWGAPCLLTSLARIGAAACPIAIVLLGAVLAAAAAPAEESRSAFAGPDEADLVFYLECSEAARLQLLSSDEAYGCARVYMKIKLSFVPGVGLDDFDALSPQGKAAVNNLGFRRYMEWRLQSAARFNALAATPL